MKNIMMMAVLVIAAVAMTGCKSKTCTLTVTNNYSQNAVVYFAENEDFDPTTQTAKHEAKVSAGKSVAETGVANVEKYYAIIFLGTGEKSEDGKAEVFKKKGTMSLNSYAGMRYVTVTIREDGMYGVSASSM